MQLLEAPELDTAELLMGYLSPYYNGEGMSAFGTAAGDRLSGPNRHLYDGLKDRIIQIGRGEEEYTWIEVDFRGSGYSGLDVNISLVQQALLFDLPFEMYWYYRCWYAPGEYEVLIILEPNAYYVPASGFDPNNAPYIDRTKTRKAAAAADNIDSIISRYANRSDYEKLSAYADEICALVEYDYDAAYDDTAFHTNVNPWTLINVFDGDAATNVVCEGYSEAYQYLCEETTFQGDIVCFSATGNYHKWNIVRIDGVSYLMDVTHCDYGDYAYRGPKFLGGGSGSVTEGYFIGGFLYAYYEETLDVYGSGENSILKLSPIPYTPAGDYAVVFSVDGDTGVVDSQTKTHGVDLTITNTIPYILGYNFMGWATSPTGTEASYQPGDTYSADADIVLYALFEESDVITGSGPGSSWTANVRYPGATVLYTFRPEMTGSYRIYSDADEDTVLNIYDAEGYWVAGDDDSGGSFQFQLDHEFQAGEVYYLDVMFYGTALTGALPFAVSRQLTISYDANGGIGAPAAEYQYYQFPTALSDMVPTRGEDTFLGWATSPTATEAEYQPYDIFAASGDVTLYAVWEKVPCTHSFGGYVVTKEATCEEPGMAERTCTLCGEVEFWEIPAGHTIVDGVCTRCRVVGTCSETVNWCFDEESGTLTIGGTGVMSGDNYAYADSGYTTPWQHLTDRIEHVVIEEGIAEIGNRIFMDHTHLETVALPASLRTICDGAFYNNTALREVEMRDGLLTIEFGAFYGCRALETIRIPDTVTSMGAYAFYGCTGLTTVELPDSLERIDGYTFSGCTALTGIRIPEGISYIGSGAFEACTMLEKVEFSADVPFIGYGAFDGVVAEVSYPANNGTWTSDVMQDYGGSITWVPYGGVENRITIPAAELEGQTSVWVDGRQWAVTEENGSAFVDLPDSNAKTVVACTFGTSNGKPYPKSMKVWTLSNTNGIYTAARAEVLDDALLYEGCSIRIDGTRGIRMITSVDAADKAALTGAGLAGYTLKEYGTAVAWASMLSDTRPLVLGRSYVKSACAYSEAEGKDPIFALVDGRIQYTNVLVGFRLDQCKDDIAMRPYMILEDAEGNAITLYGGIVERSIGYIALQNQNTFAEGTDADAFVENIIAYVYGGQDT